MQVVVDFAHFNFIVDSKYYKVVYYYNVNTKDWTVGLYSYKRDALGVGAPLAQCYPVHELPSIEHATAFLKKSLNIKP